ncbi:MAG TPA: glycoside hydrolase family 43 protein [Prolixibacteraceae bacterium]|nr:glycoside hydrolase family 43 protein [Prolixibacteraceae bacterium]
MILFSLSFYFKRLTLHNDLKIKTNPIMLLKNLILSILALSFLSAYSQNVKQFNPGEIWNDNNGVHINAHGGGILYYNGIYYWYGEHKIAGKIGNSAQVGVSCYSSKDLYNWKNESIALKVDENPNSDITKGCTLERPKVIYNAKTKKFIMWFHLELKGKGYYAARSGVAVSDKPTGPFTFLKSFRPNAGFWPVNVQPCHKKPVSPEVKDSYCGGKGCLPAPVDSVNLLGRDFKGGQMARDMNLFVDDDGTAYQIYSSEENSTLHISKLTDDYLSYSGEYFRVFVGRYMEGATLFKRAGKYYIIASDCTGWNPNAARSAVADQIFGEWKELGNPAVGKDSELTFHSQSTYVLKVEGKKDSYIFMGDRWTPENPIDGRYIWLPVTFENDAPKLYWKTSWSL